MQPSQEPRTGEKPSMPPRGKAPGLKRGRHNLPYWIAKQVVREPMGFPDKCIPLPPDADDEQLRKLCLQYTARLQAWIDEQLKAAARDTEAGLPEAIPYDGTIFSACQVYQRHPRSPFHSVKHNTRKTYTDSLKVIESTIGARLIRNVTTLDVRYYYDQWRKPKKQKPNAPLGPERIDRAHDAVSMLKTVLRFNAALRRPECKQLIDELEVVKFEKGGARTEEMTYAHAIAFVGKALELGSRSVIPADRARAMAIGVTAQFELLLRQKDIIGEWAPTKLDARFPAGKQIQYVGDETWSGYFTWENIPGWRWRMKTSKSKYRAPADFNLTNYGLLHPLLEAVPHEERTGAVVKGEHDLPIRERSYRKWFRQIARAAGIPDEVWSMDSRAGGATEAEEAGAAFEAIQDALTHSKKETTVRYIRRRSSRIASVAEARARKRAADESGGGTA